MSQRHRATPRKAVARAGRARHGRRSDRAPPPPATPAPRAPPPKLDPGKIVISAVGMIDPSDARYQNDKALLQSDLRADSRSQLVEKALGTDRRQATSLAKNYDVVQGQAAVEERQLRHRGGQGKRAAGRARTASCTITTEAVVDVKAVQKSLNQMSRDERIEFIRASGDPRVSVRIAGRRTPTSRARRRCLRRSRRTSSRSGSSRSASARGRKAARAPTTAPRAPISRSKAKSNIKRLSMRLPASGVVVTKYAMNSWTIKCIDRETGEEIYYNTTLPTGMGSWASEEEALQRDRHADRQRVLARLLPAARRRHRPEGARCRWTACPTPSPTTCCVRELSGLPA